MKVKNKWIYIVILVILIYCFLNLGNFLEKEDQLVEADAIVVLMGSIPDRILHATDLYHQGYSDKILMAEEKHNELIKAFDIKTQVGAGVNKSIAMELNVKDEDIKIINGATLSTRDEALVFQDYFKENSVESIILVTSKYHSQRAATIFNKALPNVSIISSPTPYDTFNASKWWREREDIASVFLEYLKFVNYYISDQFKL